MGVFDSVGFGEWFVLLAVILVVVGPKNLPSAARKVGSYYSKFRRAAESFKRQIMDMDTEFERAATSVTDEVKSSVDDVKTSVDDMTSPMDDMDHMGDMGDLDDRGDPMSDMGTPMDEVAMPTGDTGTPGSDTQTQTTNGAQASAGAEVAD